MSHHDEAEDPRRRILIQALSAGLFSTTAAGWATSEAFAQVFGSRPSKLPSGQAIYRITGQATINDKPASLSTPVNPGDTIKTGRDSELVFVVNTNAMIVRSNATLVIEKDEKSVSPIIAGLRMLTGALLSVSRNTPMKVRTQSATIGIRGTGFYIEADPAQTYFCTCYGQTDMVSNADPTSRDTITATHHDKPVYILNDAPAGKNIRRAPFINHTDQELALIETLVGRQPPFIFPNDAYTSPRRNY
jgi:hypothetical protein